MTTKYLLPTCAQTTTALPAALMATLGSCASAFGEERPVGFDQVPPGGRNALWTIECEPTIRCHTATASPLELMAMSGEAAF
ncbi:MAG: hypothetical protein WBL45_02630 [Solirubrobacterales bacterium]